jgi:hypothetical protein
MLRKTLIIVFALFLSVNIFAQDGNFEGTIVFNITTSQSPQPQKMKYYLKDKLVRMEVSQMPGYMLVKDSMLTVVMPVQKMYMQMDMKQNKKMSAAPDDFLKNSKPKATGKTKKILGYECAEYVVQDSNGTATVWGTEEFTNFPGFDGSGEDAFAKSLGKEHFFPMVIEADQGGVKIKMEVTEIKKEKLNSNLFTVPEGYNKIDVPGR